MEHERDAAAAAWVEWKRVCALDNSGQAAFQLLPLVYRNLSDLGVDDGELSRLRGIYRYTWSRNQLLVHTGAHAIRLLDEAGIPTIVLKGAALSLFVFRDLGARPMVDFDLLVPLAEAHRAMRALSPSFRPHEEVPDPRARVMVHHSAPFVETTEREIDLHWYALWQSAPDDDFWAAAERVEVVDVRTLNLAPADQFLHVCAHGAAWSSAGSARWVADALAVLHSAGSGFAWDRLIEQARKRRLVLTMRETLAYLAETFDAPVPPAVRAELDGLQVKPIDHLARRAASRSHGPLGLLVIQWDRYHRRRRLDPEAPREGSFPAHLRTWFGDPSYAAFLRRGARSLLNAARNGAPLR